MKVYPFQWGQISLIAGKLKEPEPPSKTNSSGCQSSGPSQMSHAGHTEPWSLAESEK